MLAAFSPAQTPPAAAGPPSEDAIRSWLLGGDPRLVAWGAHYALIARDQGLIPDLLDLASRWQALSRTTNDPLVPRELSPEQMDERDAMAAVLDALIQTNVPVPADTLRTLAPDFGNSVAVLLSRMPAEEAGPLSFDLYRLPGDHNYALRYVSAALLALHPPPGFAADLLASIKVHARILVVAPGERAGSGMSEGDCYRISEQPRKDWPVTGQYALTRQKSDSALPLVGGIDPVYARRELSTHYLGDLCGISYGVGLGPRQRLQLIAEMLGISPEAIQWQTALVTNIEFYSRPQFYNAVLAFIEEQQEKYRATVAELAAHGLLTPEEARQTLPALVLHFSGVPGDGIGPVPSLSNLPAHVEWSSTPF
jgi:hypothetical protein